MNIDHLDITVDSAALSLVARRLINNGNALALERLVLLLFGATRRLTACTAGGNRRLRSLL